MLRAGLVACLAVGGAAQVVCDRDDACQYSIGYKGRTVNFDFRGLCNGAGDYMLNDGIGHTYYAQICGYAARPCLPYWENEYEYGRVIQTWGSPPTCNTSAPACVEERTGAPTCCSEPCQVIAVQSPVFSSIVSGDPTQGVQLTYTGETPTQSDPYHCDINPATGTFYPRVTHMQFICDSSVDGFASLYEVDQNATDDCDYTIKFKTSLVCIPATAISGGWIFCILVFVSFGLYAIGGMAWGYYKRRTCEFPNKAFWGELDSLIFDGVRFIFARCRKPAPRKQASGGAYSGVASSTTSSVDSSSSGAVAADDPPAAGSRGYGGYNTIGTERSTAYTDL